MCLAVERMERKPDFRPRFQFCDVDNENPVTVEHIAYLADALGIEIERLSAYDIPGLIDEEAFRRKRESIPVNWSKELRRKRHSTACNERRDAIPALAPGCRHSPERSAAMKQWLADCDCPEVVSPAVSDARIAEAVAALQSTGNAFLDMCLIHGRFPSKRAKFCTEELKIMPLMAHKEPIWRAGGTTFDWVGERAAESPGRAKKPMLERARVLEGTKIVNRPIHKWSAADTFAIAERHGLRPNPLYLLGASRVGCWPCINCRKKEVRLVARHTPEKIDWMREAERLVSLVSRRDAAGGGDWATFFAADKVPGDPDDWSRAAIDKVVAWAGTARGGRQFDMLAAIEDASPLVCESEYGLCE